jgi:hypothetical protein
MLLVGNIGALDVFLLGKCIEDAFAGIDPCDTHDHSAIDVVEGAYPRFTHVVETDHPPIVSQITQDPLGIVKEGLNTLGGLPGVNRLAIGQFGNIFTSDFPIDIDQDSRAR